MRIHAPGEAPGPTARVRGWWVRPAVSRRNGRPHDPVRPSPKGPGYEQARGPAPTADGAGPRSRTDGPATVARPPATGPPETRDRAAGNPLTGPPETAGPERRRTDRRDPAGARVPGPRVPGPVPCGPRLSRGPDTTGGEDRPAGDRTQVGRRPDPRHLPHSTATVPKGRRTVRAGPRSTRAGAMLPVLRFSGPRGVARRAPRRRRPAAPDRRPGAPDLTRAAAGAAPGAVPNRGIRAVRRHTIVPRTPGPAPGPSRAARGHRGGGAGCCPWPLGNADLRRHG